MDETAVAPIDVKNEILASVLIGGDLGRLRPEELLNYYQALCQSLKLNPLTKPFERLMLGGKTIFYATKNATDQLRMIHQVQLEIIKTEEVMDLYIVRVRATLPSGRSDDEIGAVPIKGLQGEALANAFMKCTTKAKRRATLSVVGLSMLDESELDSLPRIERPVTRELAPQAPPLEVADAPEQTTEIRDFLIEEIMTLLKQMVPGNTPMDREHRLQLIQRCFAVKGWPSVEKLTIAKLQAGYAQLQELVGLTEDMLEMDQEEDDDDVPLQASAETPDALLDVDQVMPGPMPPVAEEVTTEPLDIVEPESDARDDEIPQVDVGDDGFVTATGVALLHRRASRYGQTALLAKILGSSPGWPLAQFRYGWVQVADAAKKAAKV